MLGCSLQQVLLSNHKRPLSLPTFSSRAEDLHFLDKRSPRKEAMAQLENTFVLRVLLLSVLLISLASGNIIVEGLEDGNDHYIDQLLHKGIKVKSRKLGMMLDATMQDYDDAGANPKHDPRRRPGNGRNP